MLFKFCTHSSKGPSSNTKEKNCYSNSLGIVKIQCFCSDAVLCVLPSNAYGLFDEGECRVKMDKVLKLNSFAKVFYGKQSCCCVHSLANPFIDSMEEYI